MRRLHNLALLSRGELLAVEEARRFLHDNPQLGDDACILRAGRLLAALGEARSSCDDEESLLHLEELLQRLRRLLAWAPKDADSHFLAACRRAGLDPLEREILLLLVVARLGLLPPGTIGPVTDVEDVQQLLTTMGADGLGVLRALAPNGRLARSGLLRLQEGDGPVDSEVQVDATFLRPFWTGDREPPGWPVESWEELLDRLQVVAAAVERRLHESRMRDEPDLLPGAARDRNLLPPRLGYLLQGLGQTLERHPDWPLAEVFSGLRPPERFLVLILACRELGHIDSESAVFHGEGLARVLAPRPHQLRSRLRLLAHKGRLRQRRLVQPVPAPGFGTIQEDDTFLRLAEWELTRDACEQLRLPRRPERAGGGPRQPRLGLDRVVLPAGVRAQVESVLLHVQEERRLFEEWGLGRAIAYGRGMGVLFSGPPGTGKTATAEAIAHALGRDILVVDYAALQRMWVGETEKNVARVFREAARHDCVLFFDEADAVFFDRDSAVRSWEAREVNVLLQQVENFPGVCILATNRETVLDTALARRLAVKVRFRLPGPEEAAAIWSLHLPRELPLADDVDLERLARLGLSGGQIKNAVLQAARRALARGRKARVRHADLEQAARDELAAMPAGEGIGFRAGYADSRCRSRRSRGSSSPRPTGSGSASCAPGPTGRDGWTR